MTQDDLEKLVGDVQRYSIKYRVDYEKPHGNSPIPEIRVLKVVRNGGHGSFLADHGLLGCLGMWVLATDGVSSCELRLVEETEGS